MEINEVLTYILAVLFPALFAWLLRLQIQVTTNTNKWDEFERLMDLVVQIDREIKDINIRLARKDI